MAAQSPPPGGSVEPTPPLALLVAALFGGLAGWLLVVVTNAFGGIPPEVPWTAPIGLVVLTALVSALAYATHQRIQVRHERMEPSRAVALLVLGKASALAGAVVAGGYLAYAVMFLTRLDAAAPRDRVIRSVVAALVGLGLVAAGLLLERACRVPRGAGEDDPDEPDTPD